MTNYLGQVTNARTQYGQRLVIAGGEKIGKTTLACGAPGALLVPLEMGFATVQVNRVPMLYTWDEIEGFCIELINSAKQGRIPRGSSTIWDSATALEKRIHEKVISTDKDFKPNNATGLTMETAHGGYGKAYFVANDLFARWARYMDELSIYGGINCIVTCHVFASKISDPVAGEYDSWDLQLHSPKNNKNFGKREFMTQWADLIGFFHQPTMTIKGDKGQQLVQAVSTNAVRQLAVDRAPSWTAGNRYGLTGLIGIPRPADNDTTGGWNYLADAIYKSCGIDLYNRS